MTPSPAAPRRPALVALSRRGAQHATRLRRDWPEAAVYLLKPWEAGGSDQAIPLEPPLRQHVAQLLRQHDPVCFFCALGAVVRLIAPHLRSKREDPAVLAIDETARFVIPVVSGHLGGANRHAQRVARWLAALPVITTASDALGRLSVDLLGRSLGWQIQASSEALTRVAACVVNDEPVAWIQEAGSRRWQLELPALPDHVIPLQQIALADPGRQRAVLWITRQTDVAAIQQRWPERLIIYRPPLQPGQPLANPLVVGVGCDRGTPLAALLEALQEARERYPFDWDQITTLATIDRKGDEVGLLQLAERLTLPLTLYPATRLAQVVVPNPSETVQRYMGTPSVSEAAALLAGREGGKLLLPKHCFRANDGFNVTIALAEATPQHYQENIPS
ncbi:MAG: cobalamin biosynthesis protein [Magnetococcales bacterium]|nr:cobalamin biosynthesis protein [Magnetococcales bacterium]